ncbi:MAG: hypothetical protein IKR49_09135 [Clostridia bacterium]|nr:hypothetical protein [Clostridia bacterium]
MANKGYSVPDLFGNGYTHYDEKGNKIGRSEPNIFDDGFTDYDAKGNKVGTSVPNLFTDGYTHYDDNGHKVASTQKNLMTGYSHYDQNGKKLGESTPNLLDDGYTHSDGCYIATCVYGSYDCPQVWTLRRFRDDTLKRTAPGRAFVRCYYALSPTLVREFGETAVFRALWRSALDRLVRRLHKNGVADTRYEDR